MENVNFLPVIAALLLLAVINLFIFFNFDFLQPVIIFFVSMLVSVLLGIINIERWGLYVGPLTTVIVVSGMSVFAIGAVFLHLNYRRYHFYQHTKSELPSLGIFQIPVPITVLCSLIIIVLAYYSARELYLLSLEFGNHDGIFNMIRILRYPLEKGEIHFSRMISYRNLISMVIATSYLYFFISNLISRKSISRSDLILAIPILLEVPFFILSTGRRSIVHFVICGLVMAVILYQRKYGPTRAARKKMVKLIGFTGVFSISLYFILGFFTGKVSIGGRGPLTIISHYGGLSVPALEQYVSSVHVENQYFLQNTMMGIYGNLNSLGFHLEPGRPFLPFVEFQGTEHITTNVYTVFYRLLADYSFPGLLIIMFFFGVILTYFYDDLKHSNSSCKLVIYSYYGYIPFFLFIDDQFMGLFTSRTVYFCILLTGFIYLLERKYFRLCVNGEKDMESDAKST